MNYLCVCLCVCISVCVSQVDNYVQLKPHVLSTPVIDDLNSDGVTEELLLTVSYYLDDIDDHDR